MKKTLFYLAGLVAGDGYLEPGRNRIDIRAKSPNFLKVLSALFAEYSPICDIRHARIRITSKEVCGILQKKFGINKGTKSSTIKIPKLIYQSSRSYQLAYVAGWYDAEGWLEQDHRYNPSYNRVRFCVISRKAAEGLAKILNKLGFKPFLFRSSKRACVDLNGNANTTRFFKIIPVKHIKWISALAH